MSDRSADRWAAVAGAVAGAAGLAVAELIAGLVGGAPSLVIAVGDLMIRLQPPGAKDIAVELFGTNDKLALNVLIVILAVGIAAAIGVLGRRRWNAAVVAFTGVAVVLAIAALSAPLVSLPFAIGIPVIALAVALRVLRSLLGMIPASSPVATPVAGKPVAEMPDWDRRRFLLTSGSLAVGSLAVGALGRTLLDRQPSVPTTAAPVPLPAPSGSLAPLPAAGSFDIPGITPIVVPNDRFYRIDTALVIPRVDVSTWTLTVKGLVDKEVTLTYDELKALGLFEQYVTIACVSNRVGEDLVGNAKWTGVHLRDVLALAGVRPEATQIVGRSVDGFTAGFPTEWAMDDARDAMVAIGMNDSLLPADHGYPARLIVPGLFGYVSATKWLSEIELTTLEASMPTGSRSAGPSSGRSSRSPASTCRATRRASPPAPWPWPESRGRPTGGSRRWKSASTRANGGRPRSRPPFPRRPGSSGASIGRRRPATTS